MVRQNIIFSLVVKTGFMLLGAVGLASVWMAVFADVGVSLLAVLNSVRVLRLRPRTGRLDEGDNAGRAA
ncbi:MAG: Cadmium, zinc and cobalt-transporting ATPase [Firmicutes bacterium ADurb.Bin506]|nr:MAG: Cadmium, zinc and cobalt-transporting ATPase [Firmicutes bacterium ADurb.Bin506]